MVISGFSAFEGGALNDEKMGSRQKGAKVEGNSEFKRSSFNSAKGRDEMVYQEILMVFTRGHGDMHDLTEEVARIVAASGMKAGTAHIFNVGSTGAMGMIEFEPGLERDLPELLDRLIPPSRNYGHEQAWHDGNGHSHLQATLLGPSLTVPVSGGKLVLGTWQQIFHLECDIKARERKVIVTLTGE
jgi:secondary thiamine-phosphate synthase enzyme